MFFSKKLYKLREKERLSQEEFAELFGVSRQAVQKWESGVSLPEVSKIVEISKHFGISIDYLLLGRSSRAKEELLMNSEAMPAFETLPDWEFYASALMDEYKQSVDEGLDIEQYKPLFEVVSRIEQGAIKKELGDVINKIVVGARYRSDYKYFEPSQLDEIREVRKTDAAGYECIDGDYEKVYGAWMGRICGCMLGKTVECIRTAELKRFLTETDNYPMVRYIEKSDLNKVNLSQYNFDFLSRKYVDDIDAMPVDDDTNYVVLAQLIFDECGADFTPDNVAEAWVKYQPKDAYCTAERVAFCNYIKGYRPPQTAAHKNPYREWIGAQIRGDYWGYINPGNPERAAEMAWRDASISHIKNGIYGEMWVAAMLAAAAQSSNVEEIILAGLAQIPYTSRLYEDVMCILKQYKDGQTQDEVFEYIHSRYDEGMGYGWCHTISNAMIVAAALLYGGGDFGKSICMAVETGFDTDCNGATVGSILGMANGIGSIDEKWLKPFNDKLDTSIFGVGRVNISKRAEMTLEHIKKNMQKN